ncbi:hypothetical protein [Pseudomonas fluorescens]|uniref:hypothetical protein n=1 Tax=Pseudomonas fluorescens TaxID=294 RepID=UPI00123FAEE4|nr:hypothetical protein [Pseudomonas fluorescens]VVM63665.1 hypothetical protein PS639_01401 [Pseudomonas fluorescens]
MSKSFDMEVFLMAVLKGSHATCRRHILQSKRIQKAIASRWDRGNPWTWQRKHLAWFVSFYLKSHGASSRYYYLLTVKLIVMRLGKAWLFP